MNNNALTPTSLIDSSEETSFSIDPLLNASNELQAAKPTSDHDAPTLHPTSLFLPDFELPPIEFLDESILDPLPLETQTQQLTLSPWVLSKTQLLVSLYSDYRSFVQGGCYLSAMDTLKVLDRLLQTFLRMFGSNSSSATSSIPSNHSSLSNNSPSLPSSSSNNKNLLTLPSSISSSISSSFSSAFSSSSSVLLSVTSSLLLTSQVDQHQDPQPLSNKQSHLSSPEPARLLRLSPARILGQDFPSTPILRESLIEIAAELKYLLGLHYFGGLDVLSNPLRAWAYWKQAWELSGRHYLQKSGHCYTHSGPLAEAAGYSILKTYFNSDLFPRLEWKAPGSWSLKAAVIPRPSSLNLPGPGAASAPSFSSTPSSSGSPLSSGTVLSSTIGQSPSPSERADHLPSRPSSYPSSKKDGIHALHSITFTLPTWCFACRNFIWGAWKQGKQCRLCLRAYHHQCARTISNDCVRFKSPITSSSSSSSSSTPTTSSSTTLSFSSASSLMIESSSSSFLETLLDDNGSSEENASSQSATLSEDSEASLPSQRSPSPTDLDSATHDIKNDTIWVNNPLFLGNLMVTIPFITRLTGHAFPELVEFYKTELIYARQMAILHEYYLEELIDLLDKHHPWPLSKTQYAGLEGKINKDHLVPYRDHIHRIWRQSEAFCHRMASFLEITMTQSVGENIQELMQLFRLHLIEQHDLRDIASEYCPLDETLAKFPSFPAIYKTLRGLLLLPLVRAPRYELLVDNCLKAFISVDAQAMAEAEVLKEALKAANQRYCSHIGRIRTEFLIIQIPNLPVLLPQESKTTVYAFLQPAAVTSTIAAHQGKFLLVASDLALYALSMTEPKKLIWQLDAHASETKIFSFDSTIRIFCYAHDPASPLWNVHEICFINLQSSQIFEIINHLNLIFSMDI